MVGNAIEREQGRIEAAIAEAESRTCGEIIVAFARKAGHYEREAGLIAFLGSLLVLAAFWLAAPLLIQHSWSLRIVFQFLFVGSMSTLVAGYCLFALLAHSVPALPMLLVPKARRARMAEEAAILAFHHLHVDQTRAHTGILLLVAEAEQTVVVLGDAPIAKEVDSGKWRDIRDTILNGIRERRPADGLIEGIVQAGDLLNRHFPPTTDDKNELSNGIYFVK